MASNKRGFEAPQYPFRLLSVTSGTSRRAYRPTSSMQRHRSMSAFGGKADINGRQSDVCF
jgi:hypothetical protein